MMAKFILYVATVFAAFSVNFTPALSQQRVDLNLILAIDCSYSVDAREFDLQIHGTAAAFTDPQIINAIEQGKYGRIAVSVVQWSNTSSQIVTVPWTVVSNRVDAYKLAIAIKSQTRKTAEGATAMSAMITKAAEMLLEAPNQADRSTIDIAADGENNAGDRIERVRDRVTRMGITINGLTILNEVGYLNYYFQNRVIGGPGAFVQVANSYNDFGAAIRKKLLREIFGGGIS